MTDAGILRYAAFTGDPSGGNPAAVAAEVGYSETAFVTAADAAAGELDVRYFSPAAEVPFCGHATLTSVAPHVEDAAEADVDALLAALDWTRDLDPTLPPRIAYAGAFHPVLAASSREEARVTIHQGHDLGRPSLLTVDIPEGTDAGIQVTGQAVALA